MKIVFMGTPDFAVPSLQILIEEDYNVLKVVTQPDRPKGRGKKITMPPVKQMALKHNLQVYQPHSLRERETIEILEKLEPDIIIVVAYGNILPKEVLSIPPLGCINVHASLLPKYRGAGPIQWAIINGEASTGITTMYMEEGLDTGDMILKKELRIGENETAGELHNRLSLLGSNALGETLKLIEKGSAPRIKQDHKKSTYAPMLTKDLGNIKWDKTADEIHNLIRGTIPWPVAYTTYKDRNMKIWKSRVARGNASELPGKIIEITKDEIIVSTGKNNLIIEEVQFSGGKRLTVRDFLVGNTIDENVILGYSNE